MSGGVWTIGLYVLHLLHGVLFLGEAVELEFDL
jgi:hypothetical protein